MKVFVLTFIQVVLNLVGATFVRVALENKPLNNVGQIFQAFFEPKLILGLGFIVSGFVFTMLVLSQAKLSYYQPVSSGFTFIVTLIISYFILKEHISLASYIGIALIMAGCLIISIYK